MAWYVFWPGYLIPEINHIFVVDTDWSRNTFFMTLPVWWQQRVSYYDLDQKIISNKCLITWCSKNERFFYYVSWPLLSLLSRSILKTVLSILDRVEPYHSVKLGQLHPSTLQKGGALPIPKATWTDFGWLHTLHDTKSSGLLMLIHID